MGTQPIDQQLQPLPRIDPQKCNGCNRCVEVCPTAALVLIDGKAVLHYPERCTSCGKCEEVCPVDAIALPYVVVFGQ